MLSLFIEILQNETDGHIKYICYNINNYYPYNSNNKKNKTYLRVQQYKFLNNVNKVFNMRSVNFSIQIQ